MTITPRFLDDLRDRLTLSEIVGRRIRLTRAGREFKACCPFHNEKSPSFYINDDKGFFHCFGCGAHGDVVGFVMRHDNLSFIETVENLAGQAGLAMPQQSAMDVEKDRKNKTLYSLMEDAAKWFEAQLRDEKYKSIKNYVKQRGLNGETASAFRVGFAPYDEAALRNHLLGLGHADEQMIEAGLFKASSKGTAPYPFFRDRVIFPVTDGRGRIIAFGGRILPDSLMAQPISPHSSYKPPKYLNSPDTPLFHKGRNLYAQAKARLAAKDNKIIVVEGYMDVIALHQAGFNGAVAPLGTALTEEQIIACWKMIPHDLKEPVLCFDGDTAGKRAAARAAERVLPLLKPNHSLRIAFMPEGEDPDTYIQKNSAPAFTELLDNAQSLADFMWQEMTSTQIFDTPEKRAGLDALIEHTALLIPDRQVQFYYRQFWRDKQKQLFAPPQAPRQNYQPKPYQGRNIVQPPQPPKVIGKAAAHDIRADVLLLALIRHPAMYPFIVNEVQGIEGGEAFMQLKNHVLAEIEAIYDNEGELALDSARLMNTLRAGLYAQRIETLQRGVAALHASFAKPGAEMADVLEKWQLLYQEWLKARLEQEIKEASQRLAISWSQRDEDRLMALKQMILKTGSDE